MLVNVLYIYIDLKPKDCSNQFFAKCRYKNV